MEQNTPNQPGQPVQQSPSSPPQQSQPPKKKSSALKTILIVLIVIIVIIAIIGAIIYFLVAKFLRGTLGIENINKEGIVTQLIDKGKDLIGGESADLEENADTDIKENTVKDVEKQSIKRSKKMDDIMVEISARQMYYMFLVGDHPERAGEIQVEMDNLYKKYGVTEDEIEAYGSNLGELEAMGLMQRIYTRVEELTSKQ